MLRSSAFCRKVRVDLHYHASASSATRSVYSRSKEDWTKATRGHNRPGDIHIASKSGFDVLNDPIMNKGVAFAINERDSLGIRGLLPPRVDAIDNQEARVLQRLNALPSDYVKYQFLTSLQDRNETLFYRVLVGNLKSLAPIIYTPTVGVASKMFGTLFRRPRGMYFSADDVGCMKSMVYNWPHPDVELAVITDGSRVLGLGDLGLNGMSISVGKLSLYSAIAGIHPEKTLPIVLDVGTNNQHLQNSAMYMGLRHNRLSGEAYYDIMDECIAALKTRWPDLLLQFEDFNNETAIPVLNRYRHSLLCFNDDIQGTGAMTVAGVLGALRAIGDADLDAICKHSIVIVGAGTAGIGIADSLLFAMQQHGLSEADALRNFTLVDASGSLGAERKEFTPTQRKYLRHDVPDGISLLQVVESQKPSVLIAVSGVPGLFSEDVVREMAKHHERPIIFPLSNPTDHAECTAQQAFTWTHGRAIFASGSPFDPVSMPDSRTLLPNQANNMYTFPGIGLGSLIAAAKHVTPSMLYAASLALAQSVSEERLSQGLVFPDMDDAREITKSIAVKVCRAAQDEDVAQSPLPEDEEVIRCVVDHEHWHPNYGTVVSGRSF